jgi:hypothetical protein
MSRRIHFSVLAGRVRGIGLTTMNVIDQRGRQKKGGSPGYYFALYAISIKMVLDFFIPARDINFFAFNGLLVVLFCLFRPKIYLGGRGIFLAGTILLLFSVEIFRGVDYSISIKMVSLPIVVVMFYSVGRGVDGSELRRLFTFLFWEFCLFFVLNYVISLATGLTSSREFWNFEHANLLGSYVLCMLIPTNYLIGKTRRLQGRLFGLCLMTMAYLSTSTGAFLLSAGIFMRARNFKFRSILLILATGIFLIAAGLWVLSIADTATYEKIVAPFRLVSGGGWARLVGEARGGGGIAYLAADQQGSFTWRIYAYLVYGFYVLNEGYGQLFFGNGVGGYKNVWNGAMPHNDFILILVDFGFALFLVWLIFSGWIIAKTWKKYPEWFVVVVIVMLRLLCENNLYSYYLASSGCVIFSLMFGANMREQRDKRNAAKMLEEA